MPEAESFEEYAEGADLRAANLRLQRQLEKAKHKTEELVEAVYQAAKDGVAALRLPPVPKPKKDTRKRGAEVAVAVLSDWQLAKALDDSTPILTTEGWTKHGELREGDYVYGPDGRPKRVLGVTGSKEQECYRVIFDKGVEIVASGDHLWEGWRRYKDHPGGRYARRRLLWTTEQIAALKPTNRDNRSYVERAFHVDLPEPLDGGLLRSAELPIEPYILGVWLGDGYSVSGRFCAGLEDREWAESLGEGRVYEDRIVVVRVPGLQSALRKANLLRNKHVPSEYLLASAADRLALLQGLMDTDGTITPDGLASFSNKREQISESVAWLATSLGMKVRRHEAQARLNGVDHGTAYHVVFRPHLPVFRLPRKAERLSAVPKDHQTRYRFVQGVEAVGPRSAQCILVEGGLYLAGEDLVVTHNTTPTYNSEVCEERIERYAEKVIELANIQRADHPVKELRVYLLGDLVEGELIFPGQAHLIDSSLYRQVMTDGPRILGNFLRRMASEFERVHVVGVIGNHGALGGRARKDYHPESNADAMMYEVTKLVTEAEPRITWADNSLPGERKWYAVDKVGDHSFFMFHGDQVKGGFAGHPWYGFGKKLQGWAMGAVKEPFRYALSGHFHTPVRMYLNGITLWGNGSTESDNTYAAELLAAAGEPCQWLLFVAPHQGVTAEYLVHLG